MTMQGFEADVILGILADAGHEYDPNNIFIYDSVAQNNAVIVTFDLIGKDNTCTRHQAFIRLIQSYIEVEMFQSKPEDLP